MFAFSNMVRFSFALLLASGSLTLPIVGDAGDLFGGGVAGAILGFILAVLFYWLVVSKVWEFLIFAFGGGVGRYHTTKLYRRLQWLTFALFMTIPVFVAATLFVSTTPIGEPSERYTKTINRVQEQRLSAARAEQRAQYEAASQKRLRDIDAARAARRAEIENAKSQRLGRIAVETLQIELKLKAKQDGQLASIDADINVVEQRLSSVQERFPFAHRQNDAFWAEINAFASALERRFGIRLGSNRRRDLASVVSDEFKALDRYYIASGCARLTRERDVAEMQRLGIFDMCSAFVVWLNFEANELQGANGQVLQLPIMRGVSLELRKVPPILEDLKALKDDRRAVVKEFETAVKAISYTEPPVRDSDFPAVDVSRYPTVILSQFPLVVDQSPIEADDPYVERISPTFLAHWWWIAPASFVLWLFIQTASQRGISRVYVRIMRFLDEGRFGFGGSARFTSMFEEWGKPYKSGSLYMGRSLYNPKDEVGLDGEAHMITVAGSRGGKGVSSIIPNLLLWEGSCVVVDPKGTNARVTAEARRKMGHNVYLIDPFKYVTDHGDSFDPFAELDPNGDQIRERIGSIADALVIPDKNAKDPHWDDGARTIIAGLIAHVISGDAGTESKLHAVRDLIKRLPEDQDRMWAEMSFNEGAGGYAKDAAMRYIRGSETNEMLGIMSNADKHTEWLSSDAMRKVTSHASFKLSDLKSQPTTVYLIIPPRELTRQKRLIRLFINLMLDAMEDGGRADVPVLMMIDEFLALDYMPEIPTAFATMASYNLVLWLFIQDMKGLQAKYEAEFNAFIANSRALQVFSTSDTVTKEYVSERLGNRPMSGLASITRSSETVPLRSSDDVEKDLKASELRQYVIEAGSNVMLLERIPYFKPNTRFAGKYDPDPDFAKKS